MLVFRMQSIAPREASVYFQMGKIFKRLDLGEEAMGAFTTALDLKPSSTDVNLIKSAIEKINVPDDEEDSEI
jgi:anaphase-promoting complex subunit 3